MKYDIFVVVIGVIVGFFFGIAIGAQLQDTVVSEQPIRPELTIEIDNTGVADTTWTYIKP